MPGHSESFPWLGNWLISLRAECDIILQLPGHRSRKDQVAEQTMQMEQPQGERPPGIPVPFQTLLHPLLSLDYIPAPCFPNTPWVLIKESSFLFMFVRVETCLKPASIK